MSRSQSHLATDSKLFVTESSTSHGVCRILRRILIVIPEHPDIYFFIHTLSTETYTVLFFVRVFPFTEVTVTECQDSKSRDPSIGQHPVFQVLQFVDKTRKLSREHQ